MKKLTRLFAAVAALALIHACADEMDFTPDSGRDKGPVFTITASVDDASTKTFLDEDGQIEWNAGDAVSLLEVGDNFKFETTESGLRAKFTHTGEMEEKAYYALYPYNASAVFAGGVVTTSIPTVQSAAAGAFSNLALAWAEWGKPFYFKNAAAWAKVSFKTTDTQARIRKVTVRSLDESVLLSGTVTLTPTLEDGAITDVTAAVTDGVPYASYEAAEGEILSPETDYYILVAPSAPDALAAGYRVEFETEGGVVFSKDYAGEAYKSAQFKRNTIAPVGRKNLDAFSTEGYFRVHYADSKNQPGTGEYLVVRKMDDGSYRILNEDKTDTYIVKGTHFELSGSKMSDAAYKRQQMEGIVAYVFRNAWLPSTDAAVSYADDELILSSGTPVSVGSYKMSTGSYTSATFYFANVTLYNRTDNTQITLTLDQLACSLGPTTDAGTLSGTFNTRSASQNPAGNANSCSDLVDALLKHATFSVWGMDVTDSVKNSAVSALKSDDNKFTGGFTTASHTSKNGVVSVNHFMIKTPDLLSGAQLSDIWLYKWGEKTYGEYINNK